MKLHRFGLIASAIVAFAFCANAQLLWEISGNGLEKPSYVFGTHHVAPASMLDSIPGFNQAIADCDVVYGEVEKEGLVGAETQQKMLAMITAPADSTLSTVLDAKTIAAIDSIFKDFSGGMAGAAQLEPMKPAFVETQLTLIATMKLFPTFNPAEQIDISVQTRAAQLGKPTAGFESADFQLGLLYGAPISLQARDLTKTVADFNKSQQSALDLTESYKRQDLNSLYSSMIKEIEESDYSPEEKKIRFEKLFTSRNKNWAEQLNTIMPQKSVLVVVGAGHLPGDDGLLDLLKRKGYTVEPAK